MTEHGTYALITQLDEQGVRTMLTLGVEGKRTLPVFESVARAEEYLNDSGLFLEWWVVDDPDGLLIEVLREMMAPHVGYVVLNPPVATKDAPAASSLIPIGRFIEDC